MGDVLPETGPKIIIDESLRQLLPILPLNKGAEAVTGEK
jgi:hypothetical protein